MVTKFYFFKSLHYVPLNGLVSLGSFYFRKGRTNRKEHKTILFLCDSHFRATSSSITVPMCTRVNFYEEYGKH